MNQRKHVKILRVPVENVLAILAGRRSVLAPNTIPPDVDVLAVHENHEFRSFDFVIAHESFPPHHPGCALAVVDGATWVVDSWQLWKREDVR